MVPKSIGIGLLFVVSSSALLQQERVAVAGGQRRGRVGALSVLGHEDVDEGPRGWAVQNFQRKAKARSSSPKKKCCCRKTSKGEDDCLNKGDFHTRGAVYVPYPKGHKDLVEKGQADRNHKIGGCCKLFDAGCDIFFGFPWQVTVIEPSASENSIQTCEGLPKESKPQENPEAARDRRLQPEDRKGGFNCPPSDEIVCPPASQETCKKSHNYMFCRTVNMAVCFITDFQNVFLNHAIDVLDAASVTRNAAKVGIEIERGVPFAELDVKDLDAGVFGDILFDTQIFTALGFGDAGGGIFIHSLKLMHLICHDEGSDCHRALHVASIAVGITCFALTLSGVGVPFHYLLNGLTSVLVGKLGKMMCDKGVKAVFRELILCPGLELLTDIGTQIEHQFKEALTDWKNAVTSIMAAQGLILRVILKMVGKLLLNVGEGIYKLIMSIPRGLKKISKIRQFYKEYTKIDPEQLKKISDRDNTCCAVKAVRDAAEALTEEKRQDSEFNELEWNGLEGDQFEGLMPRLQQQQAGTALPKDAPECAKKI